MFQHVQNYRLFSACGRARQVLADQEEECWSRVT